jgi:hypothetical protein
LKNGITNELLEVFRDDMLVTYSMLLREYEPRLDLSHDDEEMIDVVAFRAPAAAGALASWPAPTPGAAHSGRHDRLVARSSANSVTAARRRSGWLVLPRRRVAGSDRPLPHAHPRPTSARACRRSTRGPRPAMRVPLRLPAAPPARVHTPMCVRSNPNRACPGAAVRPGRGPQLRAADGEANAIGVYEADV